MKRIIAIFITVLIVCLVFVGCETEDKRSRKNNKSSGDLLSNDLSDKNDEKTYEVDESDKTEEYIGEEPQVEEVNYELYKFYINEGIDKHQVVNNYSSPQGVLYDIDSNGVDELIMAHEIESSSMPKCVYSVYTIKNNRVYELLDKELFFNLAGGPSGTVVAMKGDDGESLIGFRYDEVNPGNNSEMYHLGTWKIYSVDSTDIELFKEVEFSYLTESYNSKKILYDKSTATIGYQDISYKEFEDWLSDYYCKELFDTNATQSGKSLDRLLIDLS